MFQTFRNRKIEKERLIDKMMEEAFASYKELNDDIECPSCKKYVCINENCNKQESIGK